jgi:carbamoyltransferase
MSEPDRSDFLARCLADGKVVGHFSGRVEYGPRALGSRSILADARNPDMQAALNLKIKYRESFRPFAPSVLAERVADYFELNRESPYMLIVAPVRKERRKVTMPIEGEDLLLKVRQVRSDLPAITHVDYSARIQTVVRCDHPVYYDLIHRFEQITGCSVIINTSMNVRGEPIACTPADAYRCFMRTEMNVLALGECVLLREDQPAWPEAKTEGLESEDATKHEKAMHPEGFERRLRQIFRHILLPIAERLRNTGGIQVDPTFHRLPTTWREFEWRGDMRDMFEYSPALDSADPDPRVFAQSLLRHWTPGVAAQALLPVIEAVVALGLEYPPSDELEEEVPDSMYVMF